MGSKLTRTKSIQWRQFIKPLVRREVGLSLGTIALLIGSAGAIAQWLQPSPSSTPAGLGQLPTAIPATAPKTGVAPGDTPPKEAAPGESTPTIAQSSAQSSAQSKALEDTVNPLKSGLGINRAGALRISNPTDYPVRIALLPQRPSVVAAKVYEPPAHWDFDPEEGQLKGLLVGLSNRPNLQVKPGDVLVAFALDGSRRYWGPYVVSETELPNWDPKSAEWQLTLQP